MSVPMERSDTLPITRGDELRDVGISLFSC
jgi:hypothetical protein